MQSWLGVRRPGAVHSEGGSGAGWRRKRISASITCMERIHFGRCTLCRFRISFYLLGVLLMPGLVVYRLAWKAMQHAAGGRLLDMSAIRLAELTLRKRKGYNHII